jgi:hypothetical protein
MLKGVSLQTEPCKRPFMLDHRDGVKTWAMRLGPGERTLSVSDVTYMGDDDEDSSEEEEEEEEDSDEEESDDAPAKNGKKRGGRAEVAGRVKLLPPLPRLCRLRALQRKRLARLERFK